MTSKTLKSAIWLIMMASAVAIAADGPPPGKGRKPPSELTNNLSVPAIMVAGVAGTYTNCGGTTWSDLIAPTGTPITGYPIDPLAAYFVQKVHTWQAQCMTGQGNGAVSVYAAWGDNLGGGYGPATPDDNRIIPIYAEYYFAPTIEALQRASRELTGVEEKIHVVLGSVAGAFRPTTLKWLDELFKYRIKGDYAKTLAGKQMYELIDVIAIHYLATWGDSNWMTKFQELYHSWHGKGRIRGIWSTEEGGIALGKRNQGAYAALKIAGRYLHLLASEPLTPDQARCFFWGWQIGLRIGPRGVRRRRRYTQSDCSQL